MKGLGNAVKRFHSE